MSNLTDVLGAAPGAPDGPSADELEAPAPAPEPESSPARPAAKRRRAPKGKRKRKPAASRNARASSSAAAAEAAKAAGLGDGPSSSSEPPVEPAPAQELGGGPADPIARARGALEVTFDVAFRFLAGWRGPHWQLGKEETGLLADAWAPAIAPYLEAGGEAMLWINAIGATVAVAGPRLALDKRQRLELEGAEPSTEGGTSNARAEQGSNPNGAGS